MLNFWRGRQYISLSLDGRLSYPPGRVGRLADGRSHQFVDADKPKRAEATIYIRNDTKERVEIRYCWHTNHTVGELHLHRHPDKVPHKETKDLPLSHQIDWRALKDLAQQRDIYLTLVVEASSPSCRLCRVRRKFQITLTPEIIMDNVAKISA